jgi:hypothetical protein
MINVYFDQLNLNNNFKNFLYILNSNKIKYFVIRQSFFLSFTKLFLFLFKQKIQKK